MTSSAPTSTCAAGRLSNRTVHRVTTDTSPKTACVKYIKLPSPAPVKTLLARLLETLPELSPQLRKAARYVLDNPLEVGLSSISELADEGWIAAEVIIDEKVERDLIPRLIRAGAVPLIARR